MLLGVLGTVMLPTEAARNSSFRSVTVVNSDRDFLYN
jgi:hypothetical protein